MTDENYEEDWAIYFCKISDGQIGAVLVDVGLAQIVPVESNPFLLTFTTKMNNPTEDGLSSENEADKLNQIEENLIESIVAKNDVIYTGRIKFGGKMQSYFYSEKINGLESTISNIVADFPDYSFEHKFTEEKNWKAYFEVLYPSPFEMQVIKNGRVIENLEKHGDKLEKERLVEHWIYFKSEIDRENFLGAIKDKGFEIVDKDITSFGDSPFSLQLSRVDKADYESVNEYVMYLWEKAQEFNGDYDGWETFIVKD